jgi:hypothetical protein
MQLSKVNSISTTPQQVDYSLLAPSLEPTNARVALITALTIFTAIAYLIS